MKKTLKKSSRSCWWSHLWFPTEDHIRLISQKSKHLLFLIVSIAVVIPTRLKLGVKILRCLSTEFAFVFFVFFKETSEWRWLFSIFLSWLLFTALV